MKFIYDVLLNFDDINIYDFYEWSTEDDIEYFKKIPLIKINNDEYKKILVGSTIIGNNFFEKIYNLTEVYDKKKTRRIQYACLLTNGKEVMGVLLNKNRRIMMLSKMLIDEEDETLDISTLLNQEDISIHGNGLNIYNSNNFLTRSERKKIYFLHKELNELYNDKKIGKLKYLYYECFNKVEDDIDIIYQEFKCFLDTEWANKHDQLYNVVRLSYSKK